MPLMPNIVNMIAGSNIFSKLNSKDDLTRSLSYQSIRDLPLSNVTKKFLSTRLCHLALQNAPAVFGVMIDHVPGDLVGPCRVAYMDVILFSLIPLPKY